MDHELYWAAISDIVGPHGDDRAVARLTSVLQCLVELAGPAGRDYLIEAARLMRSLDEDAGGPGGLVAEILGVTP